MAKRPWQPLDLSTLPDCQIIACDPSLTALGLVLLDIKDSELAIAGAEKLSTVPTSRQGWDDTFWRSEMMESLVAAYLDSIIQGTDVLAVHEAPPAGGGSFVRIEASVLTGYGFRSVCSELGLQVLKTVTPQSMKKLITGNHLASKQQVAESIKSLLPSIRNNHLIKNEATRDALGIALYTANRMNEEVTNGR